MTASIEGVDVTATAEFEWSDVVWGIVAVVSLASVSGMADDCWVVVD